jgi:alpha-1,3-rhamnosyl/mannosyltransferase
VAIDCSPLLVRSAGVKTWLHHWTRGLRELAPNHVRTVFAAPDGELNHGWRPAQDAPRLALLAAMNLTRGLLSDLVVGRCNIFHVSNLVRYPPRSARISATVHDLTSWLLPELHTAATLAADRQFADAVLRRASGVLAVSENTRRDAIRILGLAPERIRVIYPGVPTSYFAAADAPATPARNRRFLFVGTIEPRKNVEGLIDAWLSLPLAWRREFELCLVGMHGWRADETARRLTTLEREGAGIRWLGYVPETKLPAMIAESCALVYPALYEGFGIPIAQAMAAGCPVITSDVSSMPEVAGGAALLVDPRSPSDIAQAIRRVGESPSLRTEMALRGRERARIFTWPRACTESLAWFSGLAEGGRGKNVGG